MKMDECVEKLQVLLQEDQSAIKLFRTGQITKQELIEKSLLISKAFLSNVTLHGFPYKDQVGEDVYKAAITLSLHLELNDLKNIFDNYIKEQPATKIMADHNAMFVDKIRIMSGEPQLYGTQYRVDKDGKIEVLPLEDNDNVDKIRKNAGLCPLSEYIDLAKQSLGK